MEFDHHLELQQVENKDHFSFQVQMLIDMFNSGELPEVENIKVEPKFGHVAVINYRGNESRIVYGHDTGYNPSSSDRLAKDKGYTKFLLRELGVNCPAGDEFLLPWWTEKLQQSERSASNTNIQTTDEAGEYVRRKFGYPVYVKPVSGSEGRGVQKIYDESELNELIAEYELKRVKVALIEEALEMPDYRLLFLDGELVNAYERKPFSVIGDGKRNIESLILDRVQSLKELGREVRVEQQQDHIARYIGRLGMDFSTVPADKQHVQLVSVSNLTVGGVPVDVTDTVHSRWIELGKTISKGFNLRVCGVDLACTDLASADSDYSVIEVNATPGAKQFMASGESGQEKLRELYRYFFGTPEQ